MWSLSAALSLFLPYSTHPDLGDVLHFGMMMRRKDGSVIRTSSRAQVFFDGDGNVPFQLSSLGHSRWLTALCLMGVGCLEHSVR
jgi:hypothetical protein